MIPASDYFAVYAAEEAPFYFLDRLQCIVAGRTFGATEEDKEEEIAFMEVGKNGYVDPTDATNFLAFCHERDITDELKAEWTKQGQAHYEKKTKAA
jgi:hypothetical protein